MAARALDGPPRPGQVPLTLDAASRRQLAHPIRSSSGDAYRVRRILLLALPLFLAAGCASGGTDGGEMAAVAPMLSVERFLQAANSRDLDAMSRLFGTDDGPVADTGGTIGCAFKKMGSWIGLGDACTTAEDVELRMDAIAQILEHDDYRIANESRVAGRSVPTTRIGVNLVIGEETVQNVPFIVVRTSEGRWLVQQIGLETITQR